MVVATGTRRFQRGLFDSPDEVIAPRPNSTDTTANKPIGYRESLMRDLKPLLNPANLQGTLVSVINKAIGNETDSSKLFQALKKFQSTIQTPPELFFQERSNFPDNAPYTLKALGTQLNSEDQRLKASFAQIKDTQKLESLVNLFMNVEDLFTAVMDKYKLRGIKKERSI